MRIALAVGKLQRVNSNLKIGSYYGNQEVLPSLAMAVASLRDKNPFYSELESVVEQKNNP